MAEISVDIHLVQLTVALNVDYIEALQSNQEARQLYINIARTPPWKDNSCGRNQTQNGGCNSCEP